MPWPPIVEKLLGIPSRVMIPPEFPGISARRISKEMNVVEVSKLKVNVPSDGPSSRGSVNGGSIPLTVVLMLSP